MLASIYINFLDLISCFLYIYIFFFYLNFLMYVLSFYFLTHKEVFNKILYFL